ncbi:hypothetical protein AX15_001607 [Amanita polypyramis BW_CC]|nr:hypothetical protein AX15_001607 [Amanita polypyramis BW_CC]
MPTTEQKLTKKQKKALAFRSKSKKQNQTNGPAPEPQTETFAFPALADEGFDSDERPALEVGRVEAGHATDIESSNKDKTRVVREVEPAVGETPQTKKRKREALDDSNGPKKLKKEGSSDHAPSHSGKARFILFVGNLKYTTTLEAIKDHFSSCDPPPVVRLLTPKVSASGKRATKSKGCAFLEFAHQKGLQQALKLHQSKLDGRVINVELTAGGGGKGEARLKKLQERNKHLHTQRQKKLEKNVTEEGKLDTGSPDQRQRFSTTSGVGQIPKQKRTWTVGTSVDGRKKSKGRRPVRNLGTGVNAIPVG